MWVKVDDAGATRITITDLRLMHPEWSFAENPSAESLAEFGVLPLLAVTPPPVGSDQRAIEGDPELADGEWRQTWTVEDIPIEELRAAIPPVSPRQARLALLGAGLLPGAEAALNALPEPQRTAALIEWDYTSEFRRDAPLVAAIGAALGQTEEQIDDLFREAATL